MSAGHSGWNEQSLGNVLTLKYGDGLPERERSDGPFPVIGSGGIVGYHSEPLVKGPGIIVGRKGSIGTVHFEKRDFWPIDTVFYVEPRSQECDIKFLYYMLTQLKLDKLNSDAAVPGLNRNVAHSQRCCVPPLPIQHKIAGILSAYDDLIENNTRRIKILEEMARTIYREWFVEFRAPGVKLRKATPEEKKVTGKDVFPVRWEIKPLGDVIELAYGKGLKADQRVPGAVPVYGSAGLVGYHNESLVEGPGIIVGRK